MSVVDFSKGSGIVIPISAIILLIGFFYNLMSSKFTDEVADLKKDIIRIEERQKDFVREVEYREDINDLKVDLRYIREKLDDFKDESKR